MPLQKDGKQAEEAAQLKTPVLPWMRVPITIEAGSGVPLSQVAGLDPRLLNALKHGQQKYKELFPVQSVVWTELAGGCSTAHDLCIAAPTGSGKTMAYVLPVVNGLARMRMEHERSSPCLQALVVLPTRDLAVQVHTVLAQLCPAAGLVLGLAAAQQSLSAEAAAIMRPAGSTPPAGSSRLAWGLSLQHTGDQAEASGPTSGTGSRWYDSAREVAGSEEASSSSQCVDVLVATPGRLMAHLHQTPGFTLRHLRYLVVDETDRLLRQSYQEWLPQVIARLSHPQHFTHEWATTLAAAGATGSSMGGTGPRQQHAAPGSMPFGVPRTVKLIVSATLTRDPSKLQRLNLHCPRYVATSAQDHRYHLPRSLQEFKLLCSAARKPLVLLALLKELGHKSTVVFASSLETTHKLFLMLQAALKDTGCQVAEFGSNLTSAQRAASLSQFRAGQIQILVASDAMTRGMDVEGVEAVVNYDAPVYAKTYVHRAGRTARAGRSGRVFTLLRDQDVFHFKKMLRKADNTYVKDFKLSAGAADAMQPALELALQQASELLVAEAHDDASATRAVTGSKRPAPAQPAAGGRNDGRAVKAQHTGQAKS